MTPQAIAERELHDAIIRYIARLRGTPTSLDVMLAAWKAACEAEIETIRITQRGLEQFGTPVRLAVALGLDPQTLGDRAQTEVDRATAMLELVPDPILPHERG